MNQKYGLLVLTIIMVFTSFSQDTLTVPEAAEPWVLSNWANLDFHEIAFAK